MIPSQTIAIERSIFIRAPRERVWQAITDASQIARWWQHEWEIPSLEVGGIVKFGMESEAIIAKIATLDPPREFAIEWPAHPDYNAIPVISRFILADEAGGTRLTVSESDYGPLDAETLRKRITQNLNGYRQVLDDLKAYLEDQPTAAVERSILIAAPIARVWQAITDPRDLDQWYATHFRWEIPDLRKGAVVTFHNKQDGTEALRATIDVLNPPHEFSVHWQPDAAYPDLRQITHFLLSEEDGGTRFTIRESGYEAVPADQRQEWLDAVANGYTASVENLKSLLETGKIIHQ